jgi:hypothetical protein
MTGIQYGPRIIYGPSVYYGKLTGAMPLLDIEGVMQIQAACGWEFFVCSHCRYYKGGCSCAKNCFITCTGANTSACTLYEIERRKVSP